MRQFVSEFREKQYTHFPISGVNKWEFSLALLRLQNLVDGPPKLFGQGRQSISNSKIYTEGNIMLNKMNSN